MKRILSATILFGLTCAALAAGPAHAKVRVVTTVQTFRSLAQEVGGDQVEVTALVGEAADPHFVDPKPSYALVLNRADLLVHVGLDLEKGWLPPLLEQSRNPKVQTGQPGNLDASTVGIPVLDAGASVSRAQGDVHPLGNPHYWVPPEYALRVARGIADRLKGIDAANAATYEQRYRDFATRLEAKRKGWAEKARPLAGVKVVTYHKSWSYVTRWLGLQEIGYVEPKPGVPPDPAHLAGLVRAAKDQGAKLVIVESYYPRNTAQKVASLAGMQLVVLASDAGASQSYLELVDALIEKLTTAAR